ESGNKADAFEPWCLFHQVHTDEPDGAVATALLLLTDRRWCHATGRLVRRIEDSGLVPDDQLDLLAQTFLAAGAQAYWEAPADWFDGPPSCSTPTTPMPPLWAGTRNRAIAATGPSCSHGRSASDARRPVLHVAENWPHRKVREAATALRHPPEPPPTPATATTVVPGTLPPTSTAQPSLF
ncbi:MAG: hypothetical protein ACRDZN_17380, partial [Acidimicrobiales bacterium]